MRAFSFAAILTLLFALLAHSQEKPKLDDPAIKVTADELVKAFRENAIAASRMYKEQTIAVVGVVQSVDKTSLGVPFISLGTGRQLEFETIICSFEKRSEDKLATLKRGEIVAVRGLCKGRDGSITLSDCRVLKESEIRPKKPEPKPTTREDRMAKVIESLPFENKRTIERLEKEIAKHLESLKIPLIREGPSGPSIRKDLAADRLRLQEMKEKPTERAVRDLDPTGKVGDFGIIRQKLKLTKIAADSFRVEGTIGSRKRIFACSGSPPRGSRVGDVIALPGIWIVEGQERLGDGTALVIFRVEIPKE